MSSPADLSTESYEAQLAADVEQLKMGDRRGDDGEQTPGVANDSAADTQADTNTAAESSSSSSSSDSAGAAASSSSLGDTSTPLTIEEIVEKDFAKAAAAKVRGNAHYARQQYPQAVEEYTQAIALCPEGEDATAEQKEQLAVYFSNRAACHLMQRDYEKCIVDCTSSLDLNPNNNPKPLGRRAKAYEQTAQYAEALEDLRALAELDPSDRDVQQSIRRVEEAQNKKNEELKEEMMGKLKGFGNTILGKFGMSLDNFKAVQDPATGSYSISFQK